MANKRRNTGFHIITSLSRLSLKFETLNCQVNDNQAFKKILVGFINSASILPASENNIKKSHVDRENLGLPGVAFNPIHT